MRERAGLVARAVVVVAVLIGAALVTALLVLRTPSAAQAPVLRQGPASVAQALTPATLLFGDRVEVEIDVATPAGVDPGSVRVVTDFRPFTTIATHVERSRRGGVTVHRTSATIQCLSEACVPPRAGGRAFRFEPTVVHYRLRGKARALVEPWETVHVVTRLEPSAKLREEPPQLGSAFRMSPALARAVLLVLTAVLGVGGAWLLLTGLSPRGIGAERRRRRLTELERALAQLDDAARLDDEETRRRALEQLATTLGAADLDELQRESRSLAWAEAPPEADELVALGEHVRARANGGRT